MFGANDYQYDARGNRRTAADWGKRNGFAMLRRRLNRTYIEDFFRLRISDAFRSKNEHTENNEDDAQNQKWSHMKHPARSGPKCAEQSCLESVPEKLLRSINDKFNRHLRRFQLASFLSRDGRTSDNVRAQSE